jgi:flagellar biosynthetic protein FliR
MPSDLLQLVPTFVLVFFRIAGMMLFAPLLGSARIPRRVKVAMALVLAMGATPGVAPPAALPETYWGLAVGIGGEMAFGLAMGMVLSLVFIAVQWAGEVIGQQMGFNISEVFDPQFGAQGSIVGEMYFMLALVVFLSVNGHHAMLIGVRASFDALPLLSVGATPAVLDLLSGLFDAATVLAVQLAAPMLVTMLVTDLALGLVGRVMPQLNVLAAGLTLKSALGILVLVVGLVLTHDVMRDKLLDAMDQARQGWTTPAAAAVAMN